MNWQQLNEVLTRIELEKKIKNRGELCKIADIPRTSISTKVNSNPTEKIDYNSNILTKLRLAFPDYFPILSDNQPIGNEMISDNPETSSMIIGQITIEDFRNIYKQGLIVAEAHRNFSIAAIKTADATLVFAETGKKQTDSNGELVGLIKKYFVPANLDVATKMPKSQSVADLNPENMAILGVKGGVWTTIEDARNAVALIFGLQNTH